MPKWTQWINDDSEDEFELVEEYLPFEPIKRGQKRKEVEPPELKQKSPRPRKSTRPDDE